MLKGKILVVPLNLVQLVMQKSNILISASVRNIFIRNTSNFYSKYQYFVEIEEVFEDVFF